MTADRSRPGGVLRGVLTGRPTADHDDVPLAALGIQLCVHGPHTSVSGPGAPPGVRLSRSAQSVCSVGLRGSLERLDVELAHLQHRRGHAFAGLRILLV